MFSNWKTVGLIDPLSPKLPDEISALLDEVSGSANPCCSSTPAIFIDGTPMTHDTRFSVRFQNHPSFLRAAVIYDFIPLDWPGYLPTVGNRIDYLAKLARLRKFDLFFPISEYAAWRLSELVAVPRNRITVTGASVRRSFYEQQCFRINSTSDHFAEPYFLLLTGPDTRKNPEVAVKAVRHLNLLYGRRIPLKIAGHYNENYRQNLLGIACHAEGEGFLEFCHDISDEELIALYGGAVATIAPSHIEGFSLPIVEASVCGCPVIASTCAAHLELIDRDEALFLSDDSAALCEKLDAVLNDGSLRASLVASQEHLVEKFHEEAVGTRFWSALEAAVGDRPRVAVSTSKSKPRLAFLSPYPPDESGAALYTALTMRAGESLFHSDLYTDARRPLTAEGNFRDVGRISRTPLLNSQYNAVISVLENSHFPNPVLQIFEQYGGPCILHDVSASPDSSEQRRQMEMLKLIIERASPLIVNTETQRDHLKKCYGAHAEVTTCCPTVFFKDEELTVSAKRAASERQRVPSGVFLISSFGRLCDSNGIATSILAVELLRSWNIPAELHFVGDANIFKMEVDRLAAQFGIPHHVHSSAGVVDEATYRDFLIVSDAAIQLRTSAFGQFSIALADCISAGLPSLASSELVRSCEAPEYVAAAPEPCSPLQAAEQLALIWEARAERASQEDARRAYLKTHNFGHYGKRLVEILGVA